MIGKINISDARGLEHLPAGKYEGYVWMSDKEKPIVFQNEHVDVHPDANAFVVEALLWDAEEKRSVHIRHTGQQMLTVYDLHDVKKSETRVTGRLNHYLPHRIDGVKRLRFLQTYEDVVDPACHGMKVSMPAELIFLGFVSTPQTESSDDDEFPFFDPLETPGVTKVGYNHPLLLLLLGDKE